LHQTGVMADTRSLDDMINDLIEEEATQAASTLSTAAPSFDVAQLYESMDVYSSIVVFGLCVLLCGVVGLLYAWRLYGATVLSLKHDHSIKQIPRFTTPMQKPKAGTARKP
jgi:protein-S-isoprenylcysteine O-methyltransferase Ste14